MELASWASSKSRLAIGTFFPKQFPPLEAEFCRAETVEGNQHQSGYCSPQLQPVMGQSRNGTYRKPEGGGKETGLGGEGTSARS